MITKLAAEMECTDILEYQGCVEYKWEAGCGELVDHECVLHMGHVHRVCPACHRKLTRIFEHLVAGRRIPSQLESVACLQVTKKPKVTNQLQP